MVKNLPANAGNTRDSGSIPRSERSPVRRNNNPLQYSCLENTMNRGAWWATVYRVTKSRTQQWLSKHNKYIITFYGWIIFHGTKLCLSILQLMDIWVTFWLLWIRLKWQLLYIFLEKAMAPHSSTLAWKIPWMEEPGRLQSMGSLRVRHDWVTSLSRIGEGNGNPLQCSCLEKPRDRGAWWAAISGVAQSRTWLKWLSSSSSIHIFMWT